MESHLLALLAEYAEPTGAQPADSGASAAAAAAETRLAGEPVLPPLLSGPQLEEANRVCMLPFLSPPHLPITAMPYRHGPRFLQHHQLLMSSLCRHVLDLRASPLRLLPALLLLLLLPSTPRAAPPAATPRVGPASARAGGTPCRGRARPRPGAR